MTLKIALLQVNCNDYTITSKQLHQITWSGVNKEVAGTPPLGPIFWYKRRHAPPVNRHMCTQF